jgi:hypothetical protein
MRTRRRAFEKLGTLFFLVSTLSTMLLTVSPTQALCDHFSVTIALPCSCYAREPSSQHDPNTKKVLDEEEEKRFPVSHRRLKRVA